LPGVKEIQTLHQALKQSPCFEHGAEWLLQLHGGLSPEEQLRVFKRPPPGHRKVVLATNVAETSITIDDVGFIVDTTRMKETRYDPARRLSSLEDVMVNRDSARQRRGRAGRVAPGVCVHLFTQYTHDHIAHESQAPEVKRVPLEQLVLRIHALKIAGGSMGVCSSLLEPPSPAAVQRAVAELVSIGALFPPTENSCEQLTRLGIQLSKLPLDARLGKLLLIGASFGRAATNDALTVAAALSSRSPFMSPQDRRYEADQAKQKFAQTALLVGPSDHLAVVNAYNTWDRLQGDKKYAFCREHYLGVRSLQAIAGLKRQLLEVLSDNGFVRSGLTARFVENQGRMNDSDGVSAALLGVNASSTHDAAAHQALVTALLCTALFPQVISIIDESDSRADKHVRELEYLKGKLANESREVEQQYIRGTIATVTSLCTRSCRRAQSLARFLAAQVERLIEESRNDCDRKPAQFFVREQGSSAPVQVSIHPASVNANIAEFKTPYLVYHELVRTTKLYVRDSTPVTPLALVLFGGTLTTGPQPSQGSEDSLLIVDGWFKFSLPAHLQQLLLESRKQLDSIFMKALADPTCNVRVGQPLLDAVVLLLADAMTPAT
jgi:HrpA-like RNA helicase